MEIQKRFDYIDIAKGLGMLTVIWGHISGGVTNIFVYSFHMPLFFFLSGLVFREDRYPSFKEFAKRKAKTLIIPYLIFSFLTWLIWVAYNVVFHKSVTSYINPLIQTIIAQGSGGFLIHNVPLWFVSCLLLTEFIYYFISKQGKDIVTVVSCIVLAVVSFMMEKCSAVFDFTLLPWSIGVAFSAMAFYTGGNLIMKHKLIDIIRGKCRDKAFLSWTSLVLMTVGLIILAPLNGHISMGHEQYNNRLLFYFNGFLGCFCVLLFSILTEQMFTRKELSWIKWIGVNSLYLMLIENPIKGFVVTFLGRLIKLSDDAVSQSFLWSMVAFVVSTIVTIIAVQCILVIKKGFPKENINS